MRIAMLMILLTAATAGAAAALLRLQARDYDAASFDDAAGDAAPMFGASRPSLGWLHFGAGRMPSTARTLPALTNRQATSTLGMWTPLP